MASVPTRTVRLHGHDVCFQDTGGDGPVVVLLHGIACSSTTWAPVLPMLAGRVRAIVPDLLGHGQSAKPRGDYSLGSHASGLRDLLSLLGHDRVTVVGHSLGGGIAMQFAYQFPERCERLVLVSSGGLGREVSPWLRAATLPGSELVLPVIAHQRVQRAAASVARLLERIRLRPSESAQQIALSYASLADAETRAAFIATARTVIDPRGQRVSAMDRLYLSAAMPTMLVWGGRDRIIPVAHAAAAHTEMPGSRLEIFENARHFPHADEPARFARVLLEFVESTTPAVVDVRTLRDELLARS